MEPVSAALVSAAAATATDAVVKEALKVGTAPLLASAGKLGKKASDNLVVALQLGFQDYMRVSYEKCRYFKSVLPPSQPRDILSHYIHADVMDGKRAISDHALFEEPTRGKKFVLTGLAGSGKSMLLKHFVASYFVHPRGPTPLFVELRRLNKFTNRNLLSFIRTDCVSSKNQISESQFEIALQNGVFALVLDGFDEVNDENKMEVQDQILEVQRLYPELMIAVSSRPDPRFRGWVNFSTYSVKELSQEKCLCLIDSFDYDAGIKKRFRDRVIAGLWESHRSFLEYPLLVSIMLLTFEEFSDIPHRQHVFYRQAFDTLLVKHDSDKEQYRRGLKTNLQLEEFRSAFAAFCGLTYLKGRISFDDDSLKEFCELASKYSVNAGDISSKFSSTAFIEDLFNAVCMLQHGGLETTFVHRSFQEYFAAYFATRLPAEKMVKVLDSFADRFNDQAIAMAFDMSREIFERTWSLQSVDRLLKSLSDKRKLPIERFSSITPKITLYVKDNKSSIQISSMTHGLNMGVANSIGEIYGIGTKADKVFSLFYNVGREDVISRILNPENAEKPGYEKLRALHEGESPGIVFEMTSDHQWWFSLAGGDAYVDQVVDSLEKVRRSLRSRDKKADEIIADLL